MMTHALIKQLEGASPLQLAEALAESLKREEAQRIARAVRYTRQQYAGGFMAHGTMRSHVNSLLGKANALGIRAIVDDILATA